MTLAVVGVEIDSGEVADHQQIEIRIFIQVDEGARVSSAKAFLRQARLFGGEFKAAVAPVSKEVAGPAVIGVKKRRRHLALEVRGLVLSQPGIEVAVAVDVPHGQGGGAPQRVGKARC